MSLQVWLPLCNNFKNLGNSSAIVTSSNVTQSFQGKYGGCFRFNGSSYLLSDTGPFSNSTEDFTYSCWFWPVNAHAGCLFSSRNVVDVTGIAIFYYTDRFLFDDGVRWEFTPSTMPTVGTWNHLTFVRKKGVGKYYYINGNLVASTTTTGTLTQCGPRFSIGQSQSAQGTASGNALNGWLCDVRVYDHALSSSEISVLAAKVNRGLQVWLPLTGHSRNQGNNGNIPTLNNISYTNDRFGPSAVFNGSSSNIIGTYTSNSTDITFSLWVKFTSSTREVHLWDARNSAGTGYQPMYVSTTGVQIGNSGASFEYINYTFSNNTWYHVAVVHDSTAGYLYVNGQLIGSNTSAKGYNFNSTLNYYVGSRYSSVNWFPGRVNDIRIYNRALNASEIKTLSQGLIAHYQLSNRAQGQENLLINTLKDQGQSHTTYNIADYNFSKALVSGSVYTITAKINTSYDKQRIGFFHSGGSYIMGSWLPIRADRTYTSTFTATANMAAQTAGGGYGYCRIYVSNTTGAQGSTTVTGTANVEWIKIEEGSKVTPYSFDYLQYYTLHYDNTIYQESDGSLWKRIYHHNNPASNLFASSDTFTTGVYKSANCWYDIESILNSGAVSRYEFMVKQVAASGGTEVKYRWVQFKNPVSAVWADVIPSTTQRASGSGYTDAGTTYGGGLYILNSNTRMCIANITNGNWWGAAGSYTAYSGGIPGAGGIVVTSGYMDIYIRVDTEVSGNMPISGITHGVRKTIEHDSSGMGNDLTITGQLTHNSDTPKYNASTFFNGTSYGLGDSSRFSGFDFTSATLSIWIKPTVSAASWTGSFGIGHDGGADKKTFVISNYGNTFTVVTDSSGAWTISQSSSLPLNAWHHCAATISGTTLNMYFDGVLTKTVTLNWGTNTVNSDTRIQLGVDLPGGDEIYTGYYSDARLYGTALSAADIKAIYDSKNNL